ncbi:hypothetical protein J7I84_07535 [Arthrobacter sp. ISL-85]|uniref:DUF5709 domain-containing protein n=1 Tax=Arthrobacter sp. ISL-85 TaxID=2819115 RepID=UPI001BE8A646|nr:DUF5709 domain-containing protein [Arthrobacter sp. ISL-85]MBT2566343.1 hypothetical protein [Arthrobacter sp. ISL-85]
MPSTDESNFFGSSAENFGLLPPDESLDSDEFDDDVEETGYAPLDRRPADLSWGFTVREARSHESLSDRLAREIPDDVDGFYGDGIGDTSDTDGEVIDDQVGSVRAGRLAWAFPESTDHSTDYLANDVGIDGGAASAEEAAMHIVIDPDDFR